MAHLIEDAEGATLEERVLAALAPVEGTYGLAVIAEEHPGTIVVARRGSPVLIGVGEGEYVVASDASAVLPYTRSVAYLRDGDIAVVTAKGYRVLDEQQRVQRRSLHDIEWGLESLSLGDHAHFMLKEIREQPETLRSTLRGRLLPAEGNSVVTFDQSHCSSSATSWARPVSVPWPISERAIRTTTVSSGRMTTQALTSGDPSWARTTVAPNGTWKPRANPPPAAAAPTTKERRFIFGTKFMAASPITRSPRRGSPRALAGRFRIGRCW